MNEELEESYIQQLKELDWAYRKLEKKYHKLQMKFQDRMWVVKKQNKMIQRLQGEKEHYVNEPKVVRKARGKIR